MKFLILQSLSLYKRWISPLLPVACRFHPTCSCYAAECFERYPMWMASKMAIVRLSKCHPFNPGGYDPVPDLKCNVD